MVDPFGAGRRPGDGNGADPLKPEAEPGPIVRLRTVDSTQEELRRRIAVDPAEGLTVIADRQSAGQGRRGSRWESPPGSGLYLSTHLHPGHQPRRWTRWTLAAGVALAEACRDLGFEAALKWPNDLVRQGRKLGGILVETRSLQGHPSMLVGVGVNLFDPPDGFGHELTGHAGSLCPGRSSDPGLRDALAENFLRRLLSYHRRLKLDDWATIAAAWEEWAPGASGHRVRFASATGAEVCDTTRGLDSDGALRVGERSLRDVDRLTWLDDPSRPRTRR